MPDGARTFRPAPALAPLSWAGAERACAHLAASGRPVRLDALLSDGALLAGHGLGVADERAFVLAACAEDDRGAAEALATFPPATHPGLVSGHVLAAWLGEVAAAVEAGCAYGEARRAALPEAYREAMEADAHGHGPPSSRSLAVSLAERGPLEWAVLEDWPLAKTLRYLEDGAVAAFLRDVEETAAKAKRLAGAQRG